MGSYCRGRRAGAGEPSGLLRTDGLGLDGPAGLERPHLGHGTAGGQLTLQSGTIRHEGTVLARTSVW